MTTETKTEVIEYNPKPRAVHCAVIGMMFGFTYGSLYEIYNINHTSPLKNFKSACSGISFRTLGGGIFMLNIGLLISDTFHNKLDSIKTSLDD